MDIAYTANQALSVREVYKESLRLICEFKDWPVGHADITDRDNGEILIPSSYWSLQPPIDRFDAFWEVPGKSKFMKGEGLPGRVWEIGKPAWIEDVMTDSNYPRAGMTDDIGVHGAFGIPIFGQQELVAVLEFYSIRTESYDENSLAVAKQIGFHLGLAIHRILLEEKLHRMNEELERRVQKRTTDLKTSNQKLEEALSK